MDALRSSSARSTVGSEPARSVSQKSDRSDGGTVLLVTSYGEWGKHISPSRKRDDGGGELGGVVKGLDVDRGVW